MLYTMITVNNFLTYAEETTHNELWIDYDARYFQR